MKLDFIMRCICYESKEFSIMYCGGCIDVVVFNYICSVCVESFQNIIEIYLFWKQNFIVEVQIKCFKFCMVCWLLVGNVFQWF